MAIRPNIPRTSEAKLQHILRHAAHIFAEQGFEGASIRDLSRASGISLSGLYYYFESKQKLLFLIQREVFGSVLRRLQKRLSGFDSPEERLRVFVHNHIEYFLTHPAEMKVLAHEDDKLEDPYRKQVAAIRRRYYNLAREIFEALPLRDSVPAFNPRVAVLSLYGMMNWVYKWHNPKVDPGASDLAESVSNIFLHGVTNSSGSGSQQTETNLHPISLDRAGAAD
jgi:TetR/AcrR family transcriptional regulator, cholesterol catabolism regulator